MNELNVFFAEIIPFLLLGTAFILLFIFGEVLYHFLKIKGDDTRKIIHAITGILTLLFPIYLKSWMSIGLLCGGFLLILFFSKKYNYIKSINDVERKSSGSTLYPIVIFCLFLVYYFIRSKTVYVSQALLFFYIPVLLLALCDPFAATIGKRFGKHKIPYYDRKKSWEGSLAFFVLAIIIVFSLLKLFSLDNSFCVLVSITIALVTTVAELLARNGWDNFFIPLTSLISLYFLFSMN